MITRPSARVLEQGFGDLVVVDALEEAQRAFAGFAAVLVGAAHGSVPRAPSLGGGEEVGIPTLEEGAAGWVGGLLALGADRRHPQRIMLVDAPRKGQKGMLVAGLRTGRISITPLPRRPLGLPGGALPAGD